MKLLLDTNVMIDYFLRRRPFFEDVQKVNVMRYFRDAELWTSAKSYTDLFCFGRKAIGSEGIQKAMAAALPRLGVCTIDGDDIRWAAEQGWKDFEDCVVSRAAQKVGADYLLTRNVGDFERSAVPAITPSDFLALVEEKYHLIYEEMPVTPCLKKDPLVL